MMTVTSTKRVSPSPTMRRASRPSARAIDPARGENRTAAWLLLALVVILALNGLNTAYSAFTAPAPPLSIGQPFATSFGFVRVTAVETVDGLTADDLGGMTHGIPGLVDANHSRIRVMVSFENASDRAIPVTHDDFRLVIDGNASNALVPSGATIPAVPLPAGSSLDAWLLFLVPRSDAALELRYQPPNGQVVTVQAGRMDAGAAGDGMEHQP
jgi:hypothetical protein